MDTVGTISNYVVAYMQQSSTTDFNINTNADILLMAINNARRWAEKAHSFHYSELDVFLNISDIGSPITAAYSDSSVAVSGTLSPNIVGAFTNQGIYNSLPFFTKVVTGVTYFLFYNGTAWKILPSAFTGVDGWTFTTASSSPVGLYTPGGVATGNATVAATTGTVAIKTIEQVMLPIAGGDYYPIEFLLNNEWNDRVQMQIGREHYNAAKTLEEVGVYTKNPVCYQQGQNLFLVPGSSFTYPVASKLSIIRWLPDYTSNSDTDFIIQRAPEYMMWQSVIETNRFFRNFVERQEGNLDEAAVGASRDAAFSSLLAWDAAISGGTTTPMEVQG